MKPYKLTLAFTIFIFSSLSQAVAGPAQHYVQVDEWEYNILKENCRMIIWKISERLAGYGTMSGAMNSSGMNHAFKAEISNYLLARGTLAARKLYSEYEAKGWKYPDILNV